MTRYAVSNRPRTNQRIGLARLNPTPKAARINRIVRVWKRLIGYRRQLEASRWRQAIRPYILMAIPCRGRLYAFLAIFLNRLSRFHYIFRRHTCQPVPVACWSPQFFLARDPGKSPPRLSEESETASFHPQRQFPRSGFGGHQNKLLLAPRRCAILSAEIYNGIWPQRSRKEAKDGLGS